MTDTALAESPAAESPAGECSSAENQSAENSAPRPRRRILAALRPPAWWPLAVCVLLGTLCGAAYGVLKPPQYTATSYVVVATSRSADPATALGFAHAYGRVVTNSAVLADAQAATGIPASDLGARVQSITSPDAPMIEIVGRDTRAERAATNANEIARALTEYANASATSTGVRLSVLSKAPTPTAPTSPSARIATAVGACAGGLLGGLLLLVRPGGGRRSAVSEAPAPPARTAAQPVTEGAR
ncbi:Wzz/FepE/Etk N-terminal domain-containing protein [Streptomyces sp. 7N604]|uniref:Wzz/FepE/Etk N-terminal domain-containing protein n=1 Tax=Streptomyces sp. 7N604 TaxID=3457415 RepID=UPI003FD12136